MTIKISCRNESITVPDKQFIRSLSGGLSHYFNNILHVEWDIKVQRNNRTVSCRLHSRSGYYRASAISKDLRNAVNLVYDKLTKQRRRKKSMKKTARRVINKGRG